MTQRALIIAALSSQTVEIAGALACDDSRYLVSILQALGASVVADWAAERITVTPPAERAGPALFAAPAKPLYCGNAGTAMRFSCALALLCDRPITLDGDTRMRQRPIGGMAQALRGLGSHITFAGDSDHPPLTIAPPARTASTTAVDCTHSSQFASGLLLVAPRLAQGLHLQLVNSHVSRPYLQMTVDMVHRAGGEIRWVNQDALAVCASAYTATTLPIEVDWSAAAFPLAAGFVTKVPIRVPRLAPPQHSLQGDAAFAGYLAELERPRPHHFDLNGTPDLIAPLVAAALFAAQPTEIRGAAHTRVKESDRIAVLTEEFRKVGATIETYPDGMKVFPLAQQGGPTVTLDPANDHRMAMAFGIASLRLPQIQVSNPACVSKSYPSFWQDLERIREQAG